MVPLYFTKPEIPFLLTLIYATSWIGFNVIIMYRFASFLENLTVVSEKLTFR